MRVNSYNKFFAKVAKIMNTEVKSVKPIDGRYKVELSNHVYLNVYRGVSGSLGIHDHRGIAHTTSCYDFDDFKTMKDLYYRLITEYCESTNNDIKGHIYVDSDSVKVAPLPEQQTSEESITDTIIADDNSSYNIEVLRAKQDLNAKYSNSYRKHLHAIINPEWHHVSLAALANIDNDMLDNKRRHYMKVYRMTANVINSIYKCNKLTSIDKLRTNLIQTVRTMAKNEKIEWALVQYVKAKIDNCYLVNGLQSSFYSKTYGHNKSRSYTKTFFI